jgi:type IV fimbrial biogenesis protein FimT
MKNWISDPLRDNFKSRIPNRPSQAGFTMVEILIVMVLLAIGTALSLPSFNAMVEKRRVINGAEQIMAFVDSARNEAIMRNQVVTVSYARSASDSWCIGVVVGATACDCTEVDSTVADYCAIDDAPRIINNTMVGNTDLVTAMVGTSPYSFDPIRGLMVDLTDSLVVAMSSTQGNYLIDLAVNKTGQVSICSKNSDHAVPGFPVCST